MVADAAVNERWGEAARTRLRLRARAPLPAKKARAAIRLFKDTHGQARWRLTRMPPRGEHLGETAYTCPMASLIAKLRKWLGIGKTT